MRGYCGIGIYHTKSAFNIGTLWRSAQLFGASFLFTIGRRYKRQASDTMKATKHLPLYNFIDFDDFRQHTPSDCLVIGVEMHERAILLPCFSHPERAIYLLGAEDHGLPPAVLDRCHQIVQIPGVTLSLNVATAGSIVLYDRMVASRLSVTVTVGAATPPPPPAPPPIQAATRARTLVAAR